MCDYNFDYTEALFILAQLVQIVVNFFEDVWGLIFLVEISALKNFSDDMGPLLIDWEFVYMSLESYFNEIFFRLSGDVVKNGLYGVSALLVAADLDEVFLDQLQDSKPLFNWAVRKQFLEEIVAILVPHNGWQLFADLFQ